MHSQDGYDKGRPPEPLGKFVGETGVEQEAAHPHKEVLGSYVPLAAVGNWENPAIVENAIGNASTHSTYRRGNYVVDAQKR